MADKEKPVIAALDNANAYQEKIRTRVRWLADQLKGKELRAAEQWLAEIILATQAAQAELKEIRRLEHERRQTGAYSDPDDIIAQLL